MDLDRRFLNDDLRSVMSERRKFDNEIRKNNSKNDYVAYINYEIMIWKRLKSRAYDGGTNALEAVAKKIINLHNRALAYFKDDLNLWLSLIKFCMEADYHGLLSETFSRMLTYRTDKHLWLLAAKWEIDEYENIEKALEYLYRALFYHSSESSIYSEIFRLELETPKYLFDLTNTSEIEETAVGKATKIFNAVQNKIPDNVDFYINLLKTASQYPYTTKLQIDIMQHMVKSFPKNEDFWDFLAKRELEGHHFTSDNKYKFISDNNTEIRLENLIKKYQYAVNIVETETMWSKYLNTLVDLQEDNKYNGIFLKTSFMRACEESHTAKLLNEEHYMKWIEHLQDSPKLLQILEEATKNKPKFVQLWVATVRCHITISDEEKIETIFDEAIKLLGDDSIQLWRLKIQYYQLNLTTKDPNKIENIYRSGLHFSPAISKLLKPQFLDWITLFKLDSTREEYKKLATEEPFCLELHKKMLDLEAMCPQPNKEILKLVSKLATEQFGEEIWMEYVQEEIDCGKNKNILEVLFTHGFFMVEKKILVRITCQIATPLNWIFNESWKRRIYNYLLISFKTEFLFCKFKKYEKILCEQGISQNEICLAFTTPNFSDVNVLDGKKIYSENTYLRISTNLL